MSKCDGWDTHKNNFACLAKELLPLFDQGFSALLDDLAGAGLLDETLVVVMGELDAPRESTPTPGATIGARAALSCWPAVL